MGAALIPFLEHDDANRALMGANMQKQAVPLVGRGPLHRHRRRGRAARAADMLMALGNGTVTEVDGDHVTVEYDEKVLDVDGRRIGRKVYRLLKFERSNQDTCINQKPVVREGDKVKQGDILANGPSTDNGELALGKNLLVAFMPWEGYNFEDAIILSERMVRDDVLTSIHIHEHEVDARDTKLGPEEITRDIPNLSEEPGRPRRAGDHPHRRRGRRRRRAGRQGHAQGRDRAHPEERLLRAIFGEKAREVRLLSRCRRRGQGHRRQGAEPRRRPRAPPGVNQLVKVYVAQKRKISVGDKLAGRHGNKGVISKILRSRTCPSWPTARPSTSSSTPRRPVPHERGSGPRGAPRLRRPLGLAGSNGKEAVGEAPIRGTEGKTRTNAAVHPHRHPGLRRRPLGRGGPGRSTRPSSTSSRTCTGVAARRVRRAGSPDPVRRQDAALQRRSGEAYDNRSRSATSTS